MKFQNQKVKDRMKLDLSEHFVLTNFKNRLPLYLLMWGICVLISLVLSSLPILQPVEDYEQLSLFVRSFTMISTITITFAIPTCLRSIFSAYDQYYSTKISEILLDRFPVTLLTLSSFTSLLISILIISGVINNTIHIPVSFMFYIALYWTIICIFYLFVAIEKLVYFIANAPWAVIKKLEYGVSSVPEITTKEDYTAFRQEIASMNDVASTIISKSTGTDSAVLKILESLKQIHKHYLITANKEDHLQYRFHMNACRAVDHEIVRMFRTAASEKNEQACRNIIKAYCGMMINTMKYNNGVSYFSDMIEQILRFQSYANASCIEEIKTLAYITWFFMLGDMANDLNDRINEKYSIIVRMLSASLRYSTENSENTILIKFFRIASNSEIDPDINTLPVLWKKLLDRSVFIYLIWLIDMEPDNTDRYLDYLHRYSSFNSEVFRNILPDSIERFNSLMDYENVISLTDAIDHNKNSQNETYASQTAVIMSLSLEDTLSHTLAILILLNQSKLNFDILQEYGRIGNRVLTKLLEIKKNLSVKEIKEKLSLISIIDSDIIKQIKNYNGLPN